MGGMCGIIGYVGPRPSQDILLAGLARLEYRGYDSAGIAVIDDDGHLDMRKHAGKLSVLRDDVAAHPMPDGTTGIGHTRWATHGGPTDENAHPHLADEGRLALIHNGIIENFAELKAELLAAGAEGKRAALPHARIVLHQPAAQGRGTIPDLILQADELVRVRSDMEAILSRHTGQTVQALRADTDRDRLFTAAAAKDYGLIDQVIDQA